MKSLGFSFIDTFSYSKKEKKKKTTTVVTRLFSTDRCPSLAALADVARSNQFLPPLRNPLNGARRKSLSHLITGPGSELTDVLTFTPFLVQISRAAFLRRSPQLRL